MFPEPLCPSSVALDRRLLHMVFSTVKDKSTMQTPYSDLYFTVLKTMCSNIDLALLKVGIMVPETC